MFARHFAAFFTVAVSLTQCLDGDPKRFEPYPICRECRDPELMFAPGIGFDLTHAYGTAAVRFENGTVIYVGKVEGNDAFISLMIHKSDESSRPKRPETILEKFRDAWEHAKRQRNKGRGLPATEDVGTIASVLISLRSITEIYLGHHITAAVTAIPDLPGLTREDLEDAMEYAGLKMLRSYNYFGDVDQVSAAYAGLGNGLCEHPEDIETCEDEEVNMRYHDVLSISFTDFILGLKMSRCESHHCWDYVSDEDFNLGLRFKHQYGPEWRYWTAVRRKIRRFAELNIGLDKLQLFGEAASNENFLEVLRGALRDLEPRSQTAIGSIEKTEPLSLVARGAAEFAKRFQVMTWNCKEPGRCNESEIFEGLLGDL